MNTSAEANVSPTLVFSVATVPDVAGLRLLHSLPASLADNEVVEFAYQKGRALADVSNAPDKLPAHLHRIVSIACALNEGSQFRVISLAVEDGDERALIQGFFDLVARQEAQAVSWHGTGFDWAVLQYRALVTQVSGAVGEFETCGLAQLLAPQSDAQISMHEMAGLCGLPHTPRLPATQFWNAWRTGRADEIHAHCETDAVICHLLLLRFQLIRGLLEPAQYAERISGIRESLASLDAQPWREFLADWP